MSSSIYIVLVLLIIIFAVQRDRSEKLILKKIVTAKDKGGVAQMLELAKKFIGQECLIYTFSSQLIGTITEVTDGAILIKNKNVTEAVNLDFIVRIREYPRGKSGKKKSVVLG